MELRFAKTWRTRWDLLSTDPETEELFEAIRECTGQGRCHGCLAWCTFCGDVGDVCDDSLCSRHEHLHQNEPDPRQLTLFDPRQLTIFDVRDLE